MKIRYAIQTLESELKSLKRQRDVFIFQESYKLRYSGEEIGELERGIKILKEKLSPIEEDNVARGHSNPAYIRSLKEKK